MQVQVLSRPPKEMKKNLKYLIIFALAFGLSLSKNVVKSAFAESIKDFQSNITINKNGTISVEEVILYDFGFQEKHGIFRNIPINKENNDGKIYKLDINIQSVLDEKGNSYTYTTSKDSEYTSIKMGDADKLITGEHTYVIKYLVSGAVTYFSDHDELYWNFTGNEWDMPILSASSKIKLGDGTNGEFLNVICYEGIKGSTSQNCSKSIDQTIKNVAIVSSSKPLAAKEGLTFAVSFPKGLVDILEPKEDKSGIIDSIVSAIATILALLWFIVLPGKILIDSIKEKKLTKKNERILPAWFEPPQYEDKVVFSPAETGFIIDKVIDHKELTGTLIQLAQRGYLRIKHEGKSKFILIKTKDYAEDVSVKDFERNILDVIFKNKDEVNIKDLKDSQSFLKCVQSFKKDIEEELVEKQMFEKKPSSIETKMIALGMFGLLTGNILLAISAFVFGRKSTKRTLIGIEKYSEAKSLFNFLKSQDDKLDFQAQNQMFFEKLLPYATAFGVERIWAERFKDLKMIKPDWYDGDDFSDVMALSYMSHSLAGSIHSSMTPTSSSSGFSSGFSGGSSGGGGGGGGGGSW
ncbi:MAG: DUF2207 domain-containing protein [Patescibacteria group bacterium]